MVGLRAIVPSDAFTAETLGTERTGNGVLIRDGIVLTIGYLITEAATVWLTRNDGAVVEECYRYHQCFASSLRGSSQYGITCTALSGRTPCGWDDFTTDTTSAQPTGKWVGECA